MLRALPSVTVHPRTADAPAAGEIELPALVELAGPRPLRVLDFDSECRPDAYLGGDLTTRALTGIAAAFADRPGDVWCDVIVAGGRPYKQQLVHMLEAFRLLYDEADVVTGHNILRHDLPIISGALVYCGRPMLAPKLASDTLRHGPKSGLVFSRSQENLGHMFGVLADKYHMNNGRWKDANTLDADETELTRERVTSDVTMHLEVRAVMLERKLLGPPRRWSPR